MAMPQTHPAHGEWTVEDVLAIPDDGQRHEVIDGVHYVTPAPRAIHQDAVRRLIVQLSVFLERTGAGHPMLSPADVRLGHDTTVQPDLFVAPLVDGRPPMDWADVRRLLLAVEVISSGTAARDRGVKRRLYQQHADEYWIVDLDARLIERWRPEDQRPEVLDTAMTWHPSGAEAPLTLDLAAFFRAVWDS